MRQLSIGVAIAAAIALVASIAKGGVDVLDLAADPTLLSIGAVGLMLAPTTFRSPLISAFLRVFSTIFAVEYVVTGLAYVAAQAGWWPPSFSEAAAPASLPITVAIFGLLVHLISFIPVIRQITRLADPYFVTDERGDLQIGGFGTRQVTERRFASALTVALVVINQLQVAINVRLSFFNRDWFNAIQNKDSTAFWSLLFGVFCFWAAIAVVSNLVEYYAESVLKIRWRRWVTERYYGLWLDDGGLYRTALVGQKPLVLDFAREFLPVDYDEVRHIFSRRGAYRRYKDLLVRRSALERWYDFSNKAEEAVLREWCAENGIDLSGT